MKAFELPGRDVLGLEPVYLRACGPFILLTLLPIGLLAHVRRLFERGMYHETHPLLSAQTHALLAQPSQPLPLPAYLHLHCRSTTWPLLPSLLSCRPRP